MTQRTQLKAEKRESTGKSSARSLRREGKMPAILYGGKEEPQKITLDQNTFNQAFQKTGSFSSRVVEIELDGKKIMALPRDINLDPVTDIPEHADFLRVDDKSRVKVRVHVHFQNKEKAPGIKRGGILSIIRRDIEMICDAGHIPHSFNVDLDGMQIGDSVHFSSLADVPESAQPTIKDRDFTIATIVGRTQKTAEELEAEEDAAAAEAEGEAAEGGEDQAEEGDG